MIGVDRSTGRVLGGDAHLAQSIRDILTTPIGSRVMRRDYGSRIPDLIDAPLNAATIVDFWSAVAEALDAWEPRVRLTRCRLVEATEDGVEIELQGSYIDRPAQTGVVTQGSVRGGGGIELVPA